MDMPPQKKGLRYMKTPKEYSKNLKNKVLTKNMLMDCLFSVNKRAKNCRDKEKEYRNKSKNKINKFYYDKYDTEEKYREKKEEYYSQKEKILSLFTPSCIHKEKKNERTRIYSYESEYEYYFNNCKHIHKGKYYDQDMQEVVYFVDVLMLKEKYYLFYDMEEYSFHTPICEKDLELYSNLEIKEINTLLTYGKEIKELVSTQFVKKVIDLIESGKYISEIIV